MRQYSSLDTMKWLIIGLSFFCALIAGIHQAQGEESEETSLERFSAYDPNSKIVINYGNWTSLLWATVVRARMSSRINAQKPQSPSGTKINFANNNPTRFEANRVLYHYLKENDLEYIHNLRLAMESVPQAIPLHTLNRNEQLAYWLNMYNLTVYEQIAKRYPISKLSGLSKGNSKEPSMWDEKILHIDGSALSLNDIQYKVIHKIWHDPIILYGLYRGAIGGPNLRKKAYTGKGLYIQLEDNAEEFINSLRGLRFRGKDALVSKMYQWNREFFPDFETDLRRHLRKYANFKLLTRLDSSRKIETTVYDWHIADTMSGRRSLPGGAMSRNPVSMMLWAGGRDLPYTGKAWDTAVIRHRLANNSAFFLKDFLKYNNKNATSKITIEPIERKDLKQDKKPEKSEK